MAPKTAPQTPSLTTIRDVVNRPAPERLREYKYRFAQSMVFGLPVLAISYFGLSLGGPEAGRWVGLLQILLAGWVMYVGAVAMVVDALLRSKLTMDSLAATCALTLYALGVWAVLHLLIKTVSLPTQQCFAWAVLLTCFWNGVQWFRYRIAQRV
jgi:cation transport ATPase